MTVVTVSLMPRVTIGLAAARRRVDADRRFCAKQIPRGQCASEAIGAAVRSASRPFLSSAAPPLRGAACLKHKKRRGFHPSVFIFDDAPGLSFSVLDPALLLLCVA